MIPFIIGAAAVAVVGYVAYKMFSTPEVKVVVKKSYYQPPVYETSRSSTSNQGSTSKPSASQSTYDPVREAEQEAKLKKKREEQLERVNKDCAERLERLERELAKSSGAMELIALGRSVTKQAEEKAANSQCVGDVCSTATSA
jgi:hypothetical protein